MQAHHRFLLAMQLRRIKNVDDELALLDHIDEKLEPHREQHEPEFQDPFSAARPCN